MKKASFGKRMLAVLIDFALMAIILGVGSIPTILAMINALGANAGAQEAWALLISAVTSGAFALLVVVFYFSVIPFYFDGQTFGKRVAKIKLIDERTGEKPEGKFILIREVVRVCLVFATLGVSLIISIFCKLLSENGRTFYDAMSHTLVVECKPEQNIPSTNNENNIG